MKKSISGNFKKYGAFFMAGLLLVGIALYRLTGVSVEYETGNAVYGKMAKAVLWEAEEANEPERIPFAGQTGRISPAQDRKEVLDYRTIRIDFERLEQINADIIGWILFDQNGISYPIVQGADNEEYLAKMADKTPNKAGSIFMDALCAADFMDSHTILYGHNMKDLSMFGKLKLYRQEPKYYEDNRYFTVYVPGKTLRYEIFSWYEAEADDSVYQVGFAADAAFGAFVDQMLARGGQNTKATADRTDRILTLSTCSAQGKRFVVHGKLLEIRQ